MFIKFPKDDKYFSWTRHIKNKMIFYGLSEARIKSVLKSPKRKEEGIAPSTTAVMKRNDRGKKKEEIWVMFKKSHKSKVISYMSGAKLLMISAWRYPGVSKKEKTIPIPEDILNELDSLIKSSNTLI